MPTLALITIVILAAFGLAAYAISAVVKISGSDLMANSSWMRLPSRWIDHHGLTQLAWHHGGGGSDNTAALMALTVIAHENRQRTGIARVTYDRICNLTGLSRAKLANGLDILRTSE